MDTEIEEAQDAFWRVIAKAHPEIRSGDFPPDAQFAFDAACKRAVQVWLASNAHKTGPLDVLLAMGFEEWSTGGGCTALGFERPDGQQCMVTNDALVPTPGEGWDVGFYSSKDEYWSGDCIDVTSYAPDQLTAALARIAAWRAG